MTQIIRKNLGKTGARHQTGTTGWLVSGQEVVATRHLCSSSGWQHHHGIKIMYYLYIYRYIYIDIHDVHVHKYVCVCGIMFIHMCMYI